MAICSLVFFRTVPPCKWGWDCRVDQQDAVFLVNATQVEYIAVLLERMELVGIGGHFIIALETAMALGFIWPVNACLLRMNRFWSMGKYFIITGAYSSGGQRYDFSHPWPGNGKSAKK